MTWGGPRVCARTFAAALALGFLLAFYAGAEDLAQPIPSPLLNLADEAARLRLEPDALTGHQVGIIEYPYDALLLRVHLIRAARSTIDLQTFTWHADESASLIGYELVQAARRGVKVRVILDGVWSARDIELVTFAETTYPNLEFKIYRPAARRISTGPFRRMIYHLVPNGSNQRMHAKSMVVDGVIGLTGGRNIGNRYFGMSTGYNFKDREALIVGPQVNNMTRSFEAFWNFKKSFFNHDLVDVQDRIEKGIRQPEISRERVQLDTLFSSIDRDAADVSTIEAKFASQMAPVQSLLFVADDPGKKTRSGFFSFNTDSRMTNQFQQTLFQTRHELVMQSPYVIFDRRARHMMRKHYKSAPDLRVFVSTNSLGAADHVVTYAANYRLRTKVVRGLKFEVYEMMPHPEMQYRHLPDFERLEQLAITTNDEREPYLCIHSKTYVFDRRISYIGTMNLDPRSYYYNSECGVFIEDEVLAARLVETLQYEISARNSWVIAPAKYQLGFLNRVMEFISTALPIDPWPLRSTSGYELKPGAEEVGPFHPDFHDNYQDIGSFPGTEGLDSRKLWTSFLKTFGKGATPLL